MQRLILILSLFLVISSVSKPQEVSKSTEKIQNQIDNADENSTIVVEPGTYLGTIKIHNKKKLRIIFDKVIIKTFYNETIFVIANSDDLYIEGLKIYHEIEKGKCGTNCFDIRYCNNIILNKCDINRSGIIGVDIWESDVIIRNSFIYNCYWGIWIGGRKYSEVKKEIFSEVIVDRSDISGNVFCNVAVMDILLKEQEFD